MNHRTPVTGTETATLAELAWRLAGRLAATRTRLVLAESCTGGLASASLSAVAGISEWHCGSAVTYRERTKVEWLGVSDADLARETAVSRVVASQMALGVLARTPEAAVAVAITGHLGPGAPAGFDGRVFLAVARRSRGATVCERVTGHTLAEKDRVPRQREAAALLLREALDALPV